ncbi:MAG TPA: lipid-binding SYLF domain-containing protein [Casimicrobiaceae bacterium]|jgi:lipid-binding SYLF domain-containing protein|nr:lipid-binding SYLF domain-containing protein [Casimicrobiaceae bacterium]
MANKPFLYLVRGVYALLLFVAVQGVALAQSEQQALVNKADRTLSNFLRDPDMTWLQQHLKEAKGVIIAPEVVKAGFIFGGSGGRAVTLARDPKSGKWVGPAFYALATASVGFQAGVSVSEIVTLVMTDKAMNAMLSPSAKLGGDASIAAGPVGAGASSALLADFISFARAKGVYGGVNLDGSVVTVSNDWNEAYYHKQGILPPDILVRMSAHNKGAAKLLADVARAGK